MQLLLGNIGRPGGGVMAMRGHASIQGSSDIPTLYDLLPGYLPMPRATEGDYTLADYVEAGGQKSGWWSHFDEYIVSLLKAWFGEAATTENDYGFGHLPKLTGNHSHFVTTLRALDGGLDGHVRDGPEPGGRLPARGAAAARAGEDEVARGARPGRPRDRELLEGLAGDPRGRGAAPRTSRPRCS